MVDCLTDRYKGLPPRTPALLFQVIGKFYRGAVSHYDHIQRKKQEVAAARDAFRTTGDIQELEQALWVLFCEFHFYLTCWLQIDLALYRLAKMEAAGQLEQVRTEFQEVLERHVCVRERLDDIDACVRTQFTHFADGLDWDDGYWFDGMYFTVDEASLDALHRLYRAVREKGRIGCR